MDADTLRGGSVHEHDEGAGAYTLAELQAMEAAGDIELTRPGTPEAAAAQRAMIEQLTADDVDLLGQIGPDALTSTRFLRQAALAAEQDPERVGHALAHYREARG